MNTLLLLSLFTIQPRSDGFYWISDSTKVSFDDKLKECIEASNSDVIKVHIDWKGSSWIMNTPVFIRPRYNDLKQVRVFLTGDSVWNLIDYQGPNGKSMDRTPVFRFLGLKESIITGVKIVTHSNYIVGFDQATNSLSTSSGQNEFSKCRFQPLEPSIGCVGFREGYSFNKISANDHSQNIYSQCELAYYPMNTNENGAWNVLPQSIKAGHRAFVFSGYNTLNNSMKDCYTINAYGITTKSFEGQDPGGSSLYVTNFGSSGSPIVFDLNIGFNFSAYGGRNELGGTLLVQGFPDNGNGNISHVTLNDINVEDFSPDIVSPLLNTFPGTLVSVHDNTNLSMNNVSFKKIFTGNDIKPEWLSMFCNDPLAKPMVSITNCTSTNFIGTTQFHVTLSPKNRGGTWKRNINGTNSTGTVK